METWTALTILFASLIVYILVPRKRPKNFPPGPPVIIPIFGNAYELGDYAHKQVVKLGEKYGPIVGLLCGSYWTVILNNGDDIREAFSKPEFSGRYGYNPFLEENVKAETKGVVMSHGETWSTNRRFSLKVLKDHGFGKRSMESIMQEETRELVEELSKNLNVPISMEGIYNASVLNVIWSIVAGQRYELNDERLAPLLRYVYELFQNSYSGLKVFCFMFPGAASLREFINNYFPDENKKRQEELKSFFQATIQEHRETIQIGNPRDFIDSYLEEQIKAGEDNSNSKENDLNMIFTLFDLFGAGSETTSTTLNWATFLLAMHPQVQEKLFEEIHQVVGNRIVGLEDRPKLPYVEAVMAEVYRISSLAALSVPHSTTQDVQFKGYNIPKDTIVYGNFYAVHFSESIWGDPYSFKPERFLSPDENTFIRNPNLIPFSVGKRVCLGESLARDEFFLFLTNIIQQLKISLPSDEPPHSLEGRDGLVLTPEPYRVILTDRNK